MVLAQVFSSLTRSAFSSLESFLEMFSSNFTKRPEASNSRSWIAKFGICQYWSFFSHIIDAALFFVTSLYWYVLREVVLCSNPWIANSVSVVTHLVLFGKGASTTTTLCGGNDGDPVIPIAKSKLMKRRWRFLKRSDVSAIVTRKNIKDSENDQEFYQKHAYA